MSDLVERLRSVDWDYLATNNLCHEAADEIARLTAEVERMRPVVDAARRDVYNLHLNTWDDDGRERIQCMCAVCIALRAMAGEPCPMCGGCGYVITDDPRKDVDCPTCGGKGWDQKAEKEGIVYWSAVRLILRAPDGGNHPANVTESVTLEEKFPTCGGIGRKPVVSKSVQRRLEIQRG
jgi:hypothetical protein